MSGIEDHSLRVTLRGLAAEGVEPLDLVYSLCAHVAVAAHEHGLCLDDVTGWIARYWAVAEGRRVRLSPGIISPVVADPPPPEPPSPEDSGGR